MSLWITPDHDTFHVVCQYIVRDSHISKSMDHPYEKIFLSGIGEEFDVSFPAMMADHSKTCDLIGSIGICIYLDKAPVHLICLPGICAVTSAPVSLRIDQHTFWGNQFLMVFDVHPYLRLTSCISVFL